VLLSILVPDPITFFYKEFQKIYAFYFKADISEQEYDSMRWVEPFPRMIHFRSIPASRHISRTH